MPFSDSYKADELDRRQFLARAAKSYLGVSLGPTLGAGLASFANGKELKVQGKAAEHVIFLNMEGGMSHLDTFDLKPGRKVQGPVEGLATKGDFQLSHYLPKMADVADDMCVIQSMTSTQGAHEQGQYMLHSSYQPRGTIQHPSLGSWVLRLKGRENQTLPGFVSIGGNADYATSGFLGAEYMGVPIGEAEKGLPHTKRAKSVTESEFNKRLSLADRLNKDFHERYQTPALETYDTLYDEAVKLMKSKDLAAFDLGQEKPELRDQYGRGNFGQGCLLARRLVESGVRFAEVTLGGWDTHYGNFTAVEARAAVLDRAYATLLRDLKERGLLGKTLVVIATEFGRSPEIVEHHDMGRNHHPSCFSCVLAGGGVQGGRTYGKSDRNGAKVAQNPVTLQDLNATIAYALGVEHDKVIYSPSGRPFRVAGADAAIGEPVKELFG